MQQLHEGKPIKSHVAENEIKYYTFCADSEEADIDIILTPLDECSNEIVVEKGPKGKPNK